MGWNRGYLKEEDSRFKNYKMIFLNTEHFFEKSLIDFFRITFGKIQVEKHVSITFKEEDFLFQMTPSKFR